MKQIALLVGFWLLLDSRKGDRQQLRTLFSRVPTWPRCLLTALLAQSVSGHHIRVHRILSGGRREDPTPGPRDCDTPASEGLQNGTEANSG